MLVWVLKKSLTEVFWIIIYSCMCVYIYVYMVGCQGQIETDACIAQRITRNNIMHSFMYSVVHKWQIILNVHHWTEMGSTATKHLGWGFASVKEG